MKTALAVIGAIVVIIVIAAFVTCGDDQPGAFVVPLLPLAFAKR